MVLPPSALGCSLLGPEHIGHWGRSSLTCPRSWSARKGSLSKRIKGIRRASGSNDCEGGLARGRVLCEPTDDFKVGAAPVWYGGRRESPHGGLENRGNARKKRSMDLVVEGRRTRPTAPMRPGHRSSTRLTHGVIPEEAGACSRKCARRRWPVRLSLVGHTGCIIGWVRAHRCVGLYTGAVIQCVTPWWC